MLESLLQCARQGFALGLTILVGSIHSITLDSLLKLIVDLLEVTSSMKGQVGLHFCYSLFYFSFCVWIELPFSLYKFFMALQEAKECLLGRLFAYGALARSGRLTKEWNSDKNTPFIKEFTEILISLASKKRYLQEPAVSVLLDLIEKVFYF